MDLRSYYLRFCCGDVEQRSVWTLMDSLVLQTSLQKVFFLDFVVAGVRLLFCLCTPLTVLGRPPVGLESDVGASFICLSLNCRSWPPPAKGSWLV